MDQLNKVVELRLRTNLLNNRAVLATQSRRMHNILASGALATVLFTVTLLNFAMSQNETTMATRGIASVGSPSQSVSVWNDMIIKKLSQSSRSISSIGHEPSLIEKLRFGVLEGKYAIKLQDGRITEVQYQESVDSDRPKYLPKKEQFLLDYKEALSIDFESTTRAKQYVENEKVMEQYQLIGPKASPVGHVEFVSDHLGRLLSMRVEREQK